MSFTNYYFNFGYNTTLEKVAGRKKKEDDGMGLAAKLGLGAAGLGAAGLGAYYGGDALKYLGDAASGAVDQVPMEGAGSMLNQALGSIGSGASEAGQWANENLRDPMQAAGGAIAEGAQGAYDAAPGQLEAFRKAIMEAGQSAKAYGGEKLQEAKNFGADLMGDPNPGSPQSFELENLMRESAKQGPQVPFQP